MKLTDMPIDTRHIIEFMLGGLLILLLAGPVIRTFVPPPFTQTLVSAAIGLALAAGSLSLARTPTNRTIGGVIGIVIAVCYWLSGHFELVLLSSICAVGILLFCICGIAMSLRQALVGLHVDLNRLTGAVCVYMLMALAWGIAYTLIAVYMDSAFVGLVGMDFHSLWPELIYFSFVTLTTLGYGDISPIAPLPRALAYLETVIGQMYIAILIAGLVGAHLSSRR